MGSNGFNWGSRWVRTVSIGFELGFSFGFSFGSNFGLNFGLNLVRIGFELFELAPEGAT